MAQSIAESHVTIRVHGFRRRSHDAHIARVYQLQVVLEAVPQRAVERLANVVEDRILSARSTLLIKLEKGIQQQFVHQLLIRHAPRK